MPCFTKYICTYRLDGNKTLMLNTLTSAMDIVDNKTMCEINEMMANESEIPRENETELYLKLKKRGYIFNSRNDEEETLNNFKKSMELNKKARAPIFPFEFIICPTMGCNLRCTYCFEEERHHKDLTIMTNNQLDTIFNYIENQCEIINNLQKNKDGELAVNSRIKLFGGEPLLI